MKNKILIVIDIQNDFTTGSLGIGIEKTNTLVENLNKFFKENIGDLKTIVTTQDWHSKNHCSFIDNDGIWPTHCVENTYGADIYKDVKSFINVYNQIENYTVIEIKKGKNDNIEEYGADIFSQLVYNPNDIYYICGIALEYCVIETIRLMKKKYPDINIICIKNAIGVIDNKINIEEYLLENNLLCH